MHGASIITADVHGMSDFARDTLSAVVGGLVLMGLGGIGAFVRSIRNRLDRIAVEVRYIQKSSDPPIRPFYDGDL